MGWESVTFRQGDGMVLNAYGLVGHGEIPTRMVIDLKDPKRPPGAEPNDDDERDQLAMASTLQKKIVSLS